MADERDGAQQKQDSKIANRRLASRDFWRTMLASGPSLFFYTLDQRVGFFPGILQCSSGDVCKRIQTAAYKSCKSVQTSLFQPFSRFSSIMRRMTSLMLTPSSFRRFCSHFIWGAVNTIDRWMIAIWQYSVKDGLDYKYMSAVSRGAA